MAVDRAILDGHEHGDSSATVRLYSWRRPTVSLGRFQSSADLDVDAVRRFSVDVCRRPTGGRGVLHDDEVTYSIVAGTRDGLPRGTAASYRRLSAALVEAFREIGIDAALTVRPRGVPGAGACYLHATPADLSLGAAKLSGSAQVWYRDSCLQHGSFVISRDSAREAAIFGLGHAGQFALDQSTGTIERALGGRPAESELLRAIERGLSRGLGVDLCRAGLSPMEDAHACRVADEYRVELGHPDTGAYTSS